MESLSIDDLCLAAFLRSNFNLPIQDLSRNGRRVTFIFSTGGRDGRVMVREYYNGAKVVVSDFVRQLQDLRTLMHNA